MCAGYRRRIAPDQTDRDSVERPDGPEPPAPEAGYRWERFWVPPEVAIDEGFEQFFVAPDDRRKAYLPEIECWTLAELREHPCVVLLGEPGLGKTRAVRAAVLALKAEAREAERVQYLDLGKETETSAIRTELTGDAAWGEWVEQGKTLHLFLDSFDEALLHLRAVHKALVGELRKVGPDALSRLRLRVVSRSADWIEDFDSELRELWGRRADDVPLHLTLAQLTERDAARAALAEGLDDDKFLAAVAERDVEALAAIPQTLVMLLEAAKEPEGMPDTRAELFRRAVLRLAWEHDDSRRGNPAAGSLSAGQRTGVAQRIASASLLSARPILVLESGNTRGADIDPAELEGYREKDPMAGAGATFRVTQTEIREVLGTALFARRGAGRVAFQHRALAEYLTASYILRYEFDADQIASVLCDSEDGRVIPQLREVAVWIAVSGGDGGVEIVRRDPELLLRADRLQLGAEENRQLVDSLLTEEVAERLELRYDRRIDANYARLAHPKVAEQLRGVVDKRSGAPESIRRLALTIARAMTLAELVPDLTRVALDETEDPYLRSQAVRGLRGYPSDDELRELLPLATEPIEADVDDEIKGAALETVFPRVLSGLEVIAAITQPRNKGLIGTYSAFLTRFPEQLQDSELPTAVEWAARQPEPSDPYEERASLIDAIVERAWPLLDDGRVADAIASIASRRIQDHMDLVGSATRHSGGGDDRVAFRDAKGRRRVLERLIGEISLESGPGAIHPRWLLYTRPPLIDANDIGWLLDRYEAALGTELEVIWASLIGAVFREGSRELDRAYELAQKHKSLKEEVGRWFEAWEIDDEFSERMREAWVRPESAEEEIAEDAPDVDAEIAKILDRMENGEPEAFERLNYELSYGPRGQRTDHQALDADLRTAPGWERASEETRERIIAGARPYLEAEDPDPEAWFGKNSVPWRVIAGYRALHLLAELRQPELPALPTEVWKRWAPVVVEFPWTTGSGDGRRHSDIMAAALANAPEAVSSWILRRIDADSQRNEGYLFSLSRIEVYDEPVLTAALVGKLTDPVLTPEGLDLLVRWTMPRAPRATLQAIGPHLEPKTAFSADDARARARNLIAILLATDPGHGWTIFVPLAAADMDFGREVLEKVADRQTGDLPVGLGDAELAELIDMMYDYFPPAEDPQHPPGAMYGVSPRDSAKELRNRLLSVLAERGTAESAELLKRIIVEREIRGGTYLLELSREARLARWGAPSPSDVINLAHTNEGSLILSAADLQAAVIASLNRIARRVSAGTPAIAPQLWNTDSNRPKPEEELSDWLSDRLHEDLNMGGRVVNREVRVAPGASPSGRGRSTDIHLTAPLGETIEDAPTATVIVEVKGIWNPEVPRMISEQLIGRYLSATGTKHGVGVVFRFDRDGWDESDPRRKKGEGDAERLRKKLNAQVHAAPSGYTLAAVVIDGSRT